MARKSVYMPDDLVDQVEALLPDLNLSGLLQEALRQALAGECEHSRLACVDCRAEVGRRDVAGDAVGRFYRDLLHELVPLVDSLGTAEGACRIAKRVALEYGLDVEHHPLPRPPRAARERRY